MALSKGMSKLIENYDVLESVETSYKEEGGKIMKDLIKLDLDFVRSHLDADQFELNIKDEKDVSSKVDSELGSRKK